MKHRAAALILSFFMCAGTVFSAGAEELLTGEPLPAEPAYEENAVSEIQEEQDPSATDMMTGEIEDADVSLEAPEEVEVPETPAPGEEETEAAAGNPEEVILVDDGGEGAEEPSAEETAVNDEEELIVLDDGSEETEGKEKTEETEKTEAAGIVSAGEGAAGEVSVEETYMVGDDGSLTVGAEVWVSTEAGFKLKKKVGDTDAGFYTSEDGLVKVTTTTVKGTHTGWYSFDADGLMLTGDVTIAAGLPGTIGTEDNRVYLTDASLAVLYEEYSEGVEKTPVTSDLGQKKCSFWNYADGKFSYFNEDGLYISPKVLTEASDNGYLEINGAYYALKNDGTPRTGSVKLKNGSYYYFAEDSSIPGQMVLGKWVAIPGKNNLTRWCYHLSGAKGDDRGKRVEHTGYYVSKITPLGSDYYLLDKYGYIKTNKRVMTEKGKYYGSDKNGKIYMNALVKYGSYRYYFGKYGPQASYTNKWVRIPSASNRVYYFGSVAGRVEEKSGFQKVTNSKGKYVGWFYFDPKNHNHYVSRFGGTRYFDSLGRMVGGVQTVRGKKYYFMVSNANKYNGKMLKNSMVKYKGNMYYAQGSGELLKNGWLNINGGYYCFKDYVKQISTFVMKDGQYGYVNATGRYFTGWYVISAANNLVKYINPNKPEFYHDTNVVIDGLRYYFDSDGYRMNDVTHIYSGPYYVKVDRVNCLMTIYTADGTVPVKSIRISPGAAGTETPLGTYYIARGDRWQLLMGPSWGQYGSNVVGAGLGGIYIHSIPCTYPNSYNVPWVPYNILGQPASHGCIRCCVADSKWIYDYCNGARITIYDGVYTSNEALKGPLGRRALVPMTGNYDPTDPAV